MRNYLGLILIGLFLTFSNGVASAQSEYVLSYPSFMPGHPLYKSSELIDIVQEWWSFGSFAKIKYHTSLSDKKLIEAKTLFEYKQYLLGYNALQLSNGHFLKTSLFIEQAKKENKDTTERVVVHRMEAIKHIDVLSDLKERLPEEFLWQPEKSSETNLRLRQAVEDAIDLRKK